MDGFDRALKKLAMPAGAALVAVWYLGSFGLGIALMVAICVAAGAAAYLLVADAIEDASGKDSVFWKALAATLAFGGGSAFLFVLFTTVFWFISFLSMLF